MIGATWYFPMATKELAELSARRTMYVARVLFSVFVYSVVLALFYREAGSDLRDLLGLGVDLFEWTVQFAFVAIFIVVPILMANSITSESERGSLPLLLLTRMGPHRIVLEKFMPRAVLMLTFVCLVIPMLAVAYAHGGVATDRILSGAWMLAVVTVHHASFCMLASSLAGSSSGALVGSYLLYAPVTVCVQIGTTTVIALVSRASQEVFHPWRLLEMSDSMPFSEIVVHSCSLILGSVWYLWVAGNAVNGRTSQLARSLLRAGFEKLDARFLQLNKALGNVTLPTSKSTPNRDPVAWRDSRRWLVAAPQHWVRWLLSLEVTVAVLYGIPLLSFGAWLVSALVVGLVAASTFHSERRRNTLGVLLATPLTNTQLVVQKARSAYWVAALFFATLVTTAVLDCKKTNLFHDSVFGGQALRVYFHLLVYVLLCAVLLGALVWVGMIVGLAIRNFRRAVTVYCSVISLWVLVALGVEWTAWEPAPELAAFISPASAVQLLTQQLHPRPEFGTHSAWLLLGLVGAYAAWGALLRAVCLWRAGVWLGRE